MGLFSTNELIQDFVLGLLFLAVCAFSAFRVTKNILSFSENEIIITLFNSLIFFTALLRCIWFLIPNNLIEDSYAPIPVVAFVTDGWYGTLISELLSVIGTICLYGLFVLIICYWIFVLEKRHAISAMSRWSRFKPRIYSTIELFVIFMSFLILSQAISTVLFLCKVFNSELMIVYDSILMSAVSVIIIVAITFWSYRMNKVLLNLELINNRTSQPQIRRIQALTIVAILFFIQRVVLECACAFAFIELMHKHRSFSVLASDAYWRWYILLKYLSELVLLMLELIISTVITSYETSRSLPTFPITRSNDLPAHTGGISNTSTGMGSQQETIRLLSDEEARADISDTYTYSNSTTSTLPYISSSSSAVTASFSKYGSVELFDINGITNHIRTDSE